MTATNEDRERQAILEEAVEETEHDLEKFRKTAGDLLMQEQEKEDTIYDTMFQASFIEEPRVVIKSLSGIGKTAVGLALADLNPDYVVLYDFDISRNLCRSESFEERKSPEGLLSNVCC